MFGLLAFLIMGLIAGAIARFVIPGRQSMGLLKTMALGCVGSLIVGTLGSLIFGGGLAINRAGLIGSVLGAVGVLLFAMRRNPRITT